MTQIPGFYVPPTQIFATTLPLEEPSRVVHCSCAVDQADQFNDQFNAQREKSIEWLTDTLCGTLERASDLGVTVHVVVANDSSDPYFELRWTDHKGTRHASALFDAQNVPYTDDTMAGLLDQLNAVYTERTALLDVLAALFPAYLTDAPEAGEGYKALYMRLLTGAQACWHIHPRDVDLLADVPRADQVVWDGHSTTQKYTSLADLSQRLRFGFDEAR
jgi:hypothetical protein